MLTVHAGHRYLGGGEGGGKRERKAVSRAAAALCADIADLFFIVGTADAPGAPRSGLSLAAVVICYLINAWRPFMASFSLSCHFARCPACRGCYLKYCI